MRGRNSAVFHTEKAYKRGDAALLDKSAEKGAAFDPGDETLAKKDERGRVGIEPRIHQERVVKKRQKSEEERPGIEPMFFQDGPTCYWRKKGACHGKLHT